MNDILIVSEDYPGYGGFGTYAWNLYNQIKDKFSTSLLYFSKSENTLVVSDNNIYSIFVPNFYQSIDMISNKTYHSLILEKIIINVLTSHNLQKAKVVISISPVTMLLVDRFIESSVHIYRVGSIKFKRICNIDSLWTVNADTISDIVTTNVYEKVLKNNENISILPNSPMCELYMKYIKEKLNLNNRIYSNMIGLSYDFEITMKSEKKYDLIFVTSSLMRKEKNLKLVENIFKHFASAKKILVGHSIERYINMFDNTKFYEYLPNASLFKKIAKTKVLILPSHFDVGPNVILESLFCNTVPLMSLNSGFSCLFENQYVCQTMSNQEWYDKINNILTGQIQQNEFAHILAKIKHDRDAFDDLLEMSIIKHNILNHRTESQLNIIEYINPCHQVVISPNNSNIINQIMISDKEIKQISAKYTLPINILST